MKRFLVLTVLVAYTLLSLGVSVDYYYCCGKLQTISVSASEAASLTAKHTRNGCCGQTTVSAKLKADQAIQQQYSVSGFPLTLSKTVYAPAANWYAAATPAFAIFSSRPPPGSPPSAQVLYCTFTI